MDFYSDKILKAVIKKKQTKLCPKCNRKTSINRIVPDKPHYRICDGYVLGHCDWMEKVVNEK